VWLAIITLGEGWHNNHHHYPASVRQGFYWWEFDITFYMLKLMSFFGLIWDLEAGAGSGTRRGRQALLIFLAGGASVRLRRPNNRRKPDNRRG
jgi:hypothetical protein